MQCAGQLTKSTFPGSRPVLLLKGLIKIHIFPPDHVKDLRNRVHLVLRLLLRMVVMCRIMLLQKDRQLHIVTQSQPNLL